MKKISLLVLSIFIVLSISICATNYDLKKNVLYRDGKRVTGTFLLNSEKYSVKGKFVNGMADEIFERYSPDKKLVAKYFFVRGELKRTEIFYKNNNLMVVNADDESKIYFNNGQLAIDFWDHETEGTTIYHENSKPLAVYKTNSNNAQITEIYNEKGKLLYSGEDDKVDSKSKKQEFFYSTSELMYRTNKSTKTIEIFYKNSKPFMKQEDNKVTVYYKNGKPLYKLDKDLKVYNEDGKEIPVDIGDVKNIIKLN